MVNCRIPMNSIQYWSWTLIFIANFISSSTIKTICNDDHNSRTLMNQMRKDVLFSDVNLVTGDGKIRSHKLVLAGASPYFYKIFVEPEKNRQNNLTIDGVNLQTLSSIIDYIYTSQVEITNENVQDILVAANLLQLTALRDGCIQFLKDDLHLANCLKIRAYADLHNFEDLLKHAEDFVVENFSEIVKSQEFLQLSYKVVSEIISRDDLNKNSEAKMFECILTWVKHDLESRRQYIVPLMKNVRIWNLSKDYISTTFLEEPLLKDAPQCQGFFTDIFKVNLSKTDIKTTTVNPEQNSNSTKILLVASGVSSEKSIEYYNFKEDSWSKLTDIPVTRNAAGATVLYGKVYVVGGWDENRIDIYNVVTDQWTSPIGMQFKRSHLGVTTLNNFIYAIGGYTSSYGYLNTVEKFDPEREQWTVVAPMLAKRSGHGVGVIDDLLYAVGGHNGSRFFLSSVECYNPVTNTWTYVKNMHSIRGHVAVGVLNGLLYAVGGYNGISLKTAEVFDPKTGNWTMISDMNHPRYRTAVVSANNLLYVIGGYDGSKALPTVEVYDPDTNKWTMLPSTMINARYNHCAAVVDKHI